MSTDEEETDVEYQEYDYDIDALADELDVEYNEAERLFADAQKSLASCTKDTGIEYDLPDILNMARELKNAKSEDF